MYYYLHFHHRRQPPPSSHTLTVPNTGIEQYKYAAYVTRRQNRFFNNYIRLIKILKNQASAIPKRSIAHYSMHSPCPIYKKHGETKFLFYLLNCSD